MNRKQKIILWVGIGLIVAMGLFPPWIIPVRSTPFGTIRRDLGYSPIWEPATAKRVIDQKTYSYHGSIDFQRLCVQWVIVAVLTGGLVAICASRKKNSAVESV